MVGVFPRLVYHYLNTFVDRVGNLLDALHTIGLYYFFMGTLL